MKKLIIVVALISLGCLPRKVETSNNQLTPKGAVSRVNTSLKTKQIDTPSLYKPQHIPMESHQPLVFSDKQDNSYAKNTKLDKKDRSIKIESKEEKQKRYNSTLLVFYSILATIISYIAFDYYRNK